MRTEKIILPGGAGLVGQNLIVQLKQRGYSNLVVLDKHKSNIEVLRSLHPDIDVHYVDLAAHGEWDEHFRGADVVVMLQAQIGDPNIEPFLRNNVESTRLVLDAIKRFGVSYTIHISSSVVKSKASDHYTRTKTLQEKMVLESGINCVVLRPTLMFGWFDRKHLGWLSRFMKRIPVFPIPGHGRYMRQPLYVGDFSRVIVSCLEKRISNEIFNISGLEKIDYIDIIHSVRKASGANSLILKIPYHLFYALLKIWAVFDKSPPFTAEQLKALVADDEFEVIDWPRIFEVEPTSFEKAIDETFNDPRYGKVELEF